MLLYPITFLKHTTPTLGSRIELWVSSNTTSSPEFVIPYIFESEQPSIGTTTINYTITTQSPAVRNIHFTLPSSPVYLYNGETSKTINLTYIFSPGQLCSVNIVITSVQSINLYKEDGIHNFGEGFIL